VFDRRTPVPNVVGVFRRRGRTTDDCDGVEFGDGAERERMEAELREELERRFDFYETVEKSLPEKKHGTILRRAGAYRVTN
jgi:hypothetical protein